MISLNLLLSILSPFPLSLLIVSCSELCALLRGEGLASHQQWGAVADGGGVENIPLGRGGGKGTGKAKAHEAKWRGLGQ